MKRLTAMCLLMALVMAASPPAQTAPKLLELDFRDAPLSAVLQTLARTARVNLIVDGELSGKVTLHLKGLTFEQALILIAETYRLTYLKTDRAYIVRQLPNVSTGLIFPDGGAPLAIELRAYALRYARAEDIADALQTIARAFANAAPAAPASQSPSAPAQAPAPTTPTPPPSGAPVPSPPAAPPVAAAPVPAASPATVTVVADRDSNSLLVAAPVAVHLQIQAALRTLDVAGRPGPVVAALPPTAPGATDSPPAGVTAVGPNTVAVAVQYADLAQLATIVGAEQRDLTVSTDPRTRQIILTGPARSREQAVRLIAQLDRPVAQVMFSTRVVELNENASKRLGITWDWSPTIQISQNPLAVTVTVLDALGRINAFIEEGSGKILANPQIAAQDGRKASINVGQTLFIPITTTTGGTTTTTLQQINAGIKLDITPRILPAGKLLADLQLEVNSLAGFGPGGMPIISSRAVNTLLEVADGSPIIIGGLISDTTTEIIRKIPLLGDLPLIGRLFQYRESSRNYSNIVITVIPRVLMPAAAGK